MNNRITLVGNSAWSLYHFRLPIILALQKAGFSVYGIAPDDGYGLNLERTGVTFLEWPLNRRGFNPLVELRSFVRLLVLYRKIRPTLVHHYALKPSVYGTLAARIAGVPLRISTLTGLGTAFSDMRSWKHHALRFAISRLLTTSLRFCSVITFQNEEDLRTLYPDVKQADKRKYVIPGGSGIDTDFFDIAETDESTLATLRASLDLDEHQHVVVLVARMLWSKGIEEYVGAARRITSKTQGVRFLIVGPVDIDSSQGISETQLLAWSAEGAVNYIGKRHDIRELLALADLVVLPTYYREGVPRALIEAASMGKAIIATDVPGCRDVVDDGHTGLLIAPRDVGALVQAIESLLADDELRRRLGRTSREKAVREFDQKMVAERYLELYNTLLSGSKATKKPTPKGS